MARRKSNAEVGPLGVWAYDTRIALGLSPEQVTGELLPTRYNPATLRKIEGGSAPPGTRMWRELRDLYTRIADERDVVIEAQPKLRAEPDIATSETILVAAIQAQTDAISALVEELRHDRVARLERASFESGVLEAIRDLLGERELPIAPGLSRRGLVPR